MANIDRVTAGPQQLAPSVASSSFEPAYDEMYAKTKSRVQAMYRDAAEEIEKLGSEDDHKFRQTMGALADELSTEPDGRESMIEIVQLFGRDRDEAEMDVASIYQGEDIYEDLRASAQEARGRYLERAAELEVSYEGDKAQTFELLRELPDVAPALYREQGFKAIEGFPPRLKDGMKPSPAESQFIADAEAWSNSEENWGYAKLAGGIALGIGATAITGGIAGPEAAVGVGVLIGALTGGHETLVAAKRLSKMRDANVVGAASNATVNYAENELIGATGALAINLVTAGLAAKFGGGKVAGELAKSAAKSVMKEAVTGAVIGTGTGALSTAANPNVWNSDDTFGMLLKGAVIGGAGGGVGGGAGRGASIAISRAITPQFRVGSRVDVVLEGQTKPEAFVVRDLDKKSGTLTIEKDGQPINISITEAQLLKMNEQTSIVSRLRARFAKHEAPTAMEKREADFLDEFAKLAPGRTIEEGRALFRSSAGFRNDGIKGFGVREDLAPSLELAADHVAKTGEPAIAVRGSLRNLGGINSKMPGEADAVLQDVATIFRDELGKTGAKVAAFRDGPEMTFILSGKDVPKHQVEAAFVRADMRVQALAKKHGIQDLEHPKHPGEEAWMGVGVSPVTAKIGSRDNAALLESALNVRVVDHNADLGQVVPKPTRVATRAAQPVPTTTIPKDTGRTPKFLDAVEHREQLFVDNAKNLGIEEGAARALFAKSRSLLLDDVTGFASAEDHLPTLQRAIDFARKNGENAHYVEIDVRNLGGLNNAVGKKSADGDFAVAARVIREEMAGVGAEASFFRHGGDELSVVAVGPRVKAADVDAAMARAQARFDRYIDDRGLAEIPHTKKGKGPGVGITYATETAQDGDNAASLFSRAKNSCDAKKKGKLP